MIMPTKKRNLYEIGDILWAYERRVCGMCLRQPFAACRKVEEWKTQEEYSLPPPWKAGTLHLSLRTDHVQ